MPGVSSGISTFCQKGEPVIPARAARSSVSKGRPNRASTASMPSWRHNTPRAVRQPASRRISRCVNRPHWYLRQPDSDVTGARLACRRFSLAIFHCSSAASSSLLSSGLILVRFDEEEMLVFPFGSRLQLFCRRSTPAPDLLFLACCYVMRWFLYSSTGTSLLHCGLSAAMVDRKSTRLNSSH